ncbi:hypothetical protein KW797_00120 [Candidatus Parcubacteria bacterium]|nr:hypothetical protein [Candidatus Parcubacteria bacterium]
MRALRSFWIWLSALLDDADAEDIKLLDNAEIEFLALRLNLSETQVLQRGLRRNRETLVNLSYEDNGL